MDSISLRFKFKRKGRIGENQSQDGYGRTVTQNGYHYWFDPQEIDEINEHNRYHEVPNLEEELILTYFCKPAPGESGKFMSVANILERISMGIREPLSKAKIGRAMVKLGFEYKKMNNLRGYLVIERTLEQVKFNQINMGHYLSD